MKKYDFITKNSLQRKYPKKSIEQIAKILNCSSWTIRDRLIKYNIPIRTLNEALRENKNGRIDGRSLKIYHCIEPDCNNEICWQTWCYGGKRCPSCANKDKNYIHGKGYEPYTKEFNESLKAKIRKRDNYICQKCGISEKEHLIVYGEKLSIHHIDYNKFNCKENNLIALCRQCNRKVNRNRDYWYAYFTYITEVKNELV